MKKNKLVPRGRIGLDDIRAIAALCALKLSERAACLKLNIDPNSWAKFKCRHKKAGSEFADALEELRAKKLTAHIENIESASKGEGGHRPDWRASAWMAERVLSEDGKYSDRVVHEGNQSLYVQNIFTGGKAIPKEQWDALVERSIRKVYDEPETKQLPAPAATSETPSA